MDIGSILASLLATFSGDDAMLFRIEFLAVLLGISHFLAFVLDAFRLRTRNSFVKVLLFIFDTINYPLLTYASGIIQSAPFTNEFLAIWAMLLYSNRSDADYITAYGVPETYSRRSAELRELFMSFLFANINATMGHNFKILLWMLWSIRPMQILARIYYYDVAHRSYSHGRNSEFIAEYMNQECSRPRDIEPNPMTMLDYEYIVAGENAQEPESNARASQLTGSDPFQPEKYITIQKIWQCNGRLLADWDKDNRIKDVCLSYAFFKILRCLKYNTLKLACFDQMKKLIFQGILQSEDDERVFRIFEMETAFLIDYEKTKVPIIIWYRFPVINMYSCLLTIISSLFLAANLHNMQLGHDDFTHYIGTKNIDRFITYVLLYMLVLTEICEILLYTFSDWTKIKIVRKYLEGNWLVRNRIFENIAWYLCTKTMGKGWCRKMSQCNVLESYNYRPWLKRILHHGSLYMIKRPIEGGKCLGDIKIYKEVKKNIAEALRSNNIRGGNVSYMRRVYMDPIGNEFKWACSQKTCSRLIMVWHIATGMCEIELSTKKQQKRENFWYLSPMYWIKNICSRKPFLLHPESLEENLRSYYISANSISRYCVYLLIFAPELLPDNEMFPKQIFEKTVSNAREVLRSCNSLETIYERLMEKGKCLEEDKDQAENKKKSMDIVEIGAILGYELIKKLEPEDRWKMLSQYWANLLLYLAPCQWMADHEIRLYDKREFITLLWALLHHAGIFFQEEEEISVSNEEEVQGARNCGTTHTSTVGQTTVEDKV